MLIQILLSQAIYITIGLMTGRAIITLHKLTSIHNQILEEPTHKMLTLIQLSVHIYIMTGLMIGRVTTTLLKIKSIHNQISEVPTHKMHTQIQLSALTSTTTGPMTGKTIPTFKQNQANILNQTSEDKTQRTDILTAHLAPTYTMIGPTIGLTMNKI